MIGTRLDDAIHAVSPPYVFLLVIAVGIGLVCGVVTLMVPALVSYKRKEYSVYTKQGSQEHILVAGVVAMLTAVGSVITLAMLYLLPAQEVARQAAVDNIANNLDIEDIVVQETVLGRDGYQITVEYTVIGESGRETLDMVYDPGYTAMLPMSGQDPAAILPLTEGAVLAELHDTGRASW